MTHYYDEHDVYKIIRETTDACGTQEIEYISQDGNLVKITNRKDGSSSMIAKPYGFNYD